MNDRDKEFAVAAGLAKPYVSKTRRESGVVIKDIDALQKFADLIRADEREACAKVCEENATDLSEGDWDSACNNCADLIRARGNK